MPVKKLRKRGAFEAARTRTEAARASVLTGRRAKRTLDFLRQHATPEATAR